MQKSLKVLVYTSKSMQIAQCIEFDLSAQGTSAEEALHRLRYLFKAYASLGREKNHDLLGALAEAPKRFTEMFERAPHVETEVWEDCEFDEVSVHGPSKLIIGKAA